VTLTTCGDLAAPRFVGPGRFPQDAVHRMRLAEVRAVGDMGVLRYLPGGGTVIAPRRGPAVADPGLRP
jgi:hypothetical protein